MPRGGRPKAERTSEEVALELDRIVLAEAEAWWGRFQETWIKGHPNDLELACMAAFSDGFRLALPTLFHVPIIDHLKKRNPV